MEHYGYLTINEKELVYEYLWYIDRLNGPIEGVPVSDNEMLIMESKRANPPYECTDNIFIMYSVDEENIAEQLESNCQTATTN